MVIHTALKGVAKAAEAKWQWFHLPEGRWNLDCPDGYWCQRERETSIKALHGMTEWAWSEKEFYKHGQTAVQRSTVEAYVRTLLMSIVPFSGPGIYGIAIMLALAYFLFLHKIKR